jgi:regulator of replication initiation timing
MSQTLADLKHLVPTESSSIDTKIANLQRELVELKPRLREAMKSLAPLQAEHERLQARKRYLPNDRKLSREANIAKRAWAECKQQHDSVSELYKQVRQRLENLQVERRAAELRAQARDIDFLAPFRPYAGDPDAPVEGDVLSILTTLSAICESYQYQYVSGNKYYHWLIDQVARRGADGEVRHGDTANSPVVPEIESQWNDKLDAQRAKREYLTVMRMAAENAFRKMLPELPENAPFVPRMLRKTDEELEAQLEARSNQRWQAKQDAQRQVASAEKEHARREDRAYRPKL